MNWNLFEAMILGLKQNGLTVFSASFSYLGSYWNEEVCDVMQNEGRLKLVGEQ